MADKVTGVIENVKKNGSDEKPMYAFVIEGTWYGSGRKFPGKKGEAITFEASKNERGYWVAENITKSSAPSYTSNKSGQSSGKAPEERNYWNRKEERDVANDRHLKARWAVSCAMEAAFKSAEAGLIKFPKDANEEVKREQTLTLGRDLASMVLEAADKLALPKPAPTVKVVKPKPAPEPEDSQDADSQPEDSDNPGEWSEDE